MFASRPRFALRVALWLLVVLLGSSLSLAQEATSEATPEPAATTETPTELPTETPTEAPSPTETATPEITPEPPTAEPPTPTFTPTADLPAEPPLSLVFSDSFDSGDLSQWVMGGGWSAVASEGGMALLLISGDAPALPRVEPLADAAVQARVLFDEGAARLALRQGAGGGYVATLGAGGQVTLARDGTLLGAASVSPNVPGQWRSLRLSAMGGVLRVSVDGVEVIALGDPSPLPPGNVAVSGANLGAGGLLVDDFALFTPAELVVPTETPTPTPEGPTYRLLESSDPQVARSGNWNSVSNTSASGGSYLQTSDGALSVTFTGDTAEVVYTQSPDLGIFAIEADGVPVKTVITTAADSAYQSAITVTGLGAGSHVLRVTPVEGTAAIDAFLVPTPGGVSYTQAASLMAITSFVVSSTLDTDDPTPDGICASGPGWCTLREAIRESNAALGTQTIRFNIDGAPGTVHTITPLSPLPALSDSVIIDGYTQPGSAPATSISQAVLLIQLNGISQGSSHVLQLSAGRSTIRGLVINRAPLDGIAIYGTGSGHMIQGNYIGTNPDASAVGPGNGAYGIFINNIPGNVIGGATAALRNVISGNADEGIFINGTGATGNKVQGNFIGTDKTGTLDLGNGSSGVVVNSSNNIIGGTVAGARNVISGNNTYGVSIVAGAGASANLVQGNFIGTNALGTAALGNGGGVSIGSGATTNTIGGTVVGTRNVISGNVNNGIVISGTTSTGNKVQGNFIGTDVTGTLDLGNGAAGVVIDGVSGLTIGGTVAGSRNVISGNTGAGVSIIGAVIAAPNNKVQGNYIGTNAAGTAALGNGGAGVLIDSADTNTVGGAVAGSRNVISGNFYGVRITSTAVAEADGNLVQGNYIGTNAAGTAALGNGYGVLVESGSGNLIGGTVALARNVISGSNGPGVRISGTASNTLVQGNFIGTNAAGTVSIQNLNGVLIDGVSNQTIGGATTGARNLISGNMSGDGVVITGDSSNITVQGNFIGTTVTGTAGLHNFRGISILSNNGSVFVYGNTIGPVTSVASAWGNNRGVYVTNSTGPIYIGSTGAGMSNTITRNFNQGVRVDGASSDVRVIGNVITYNGVASSSPSGFGDGVDVSGAATGVQVYANSIHSNSDLGIDLGGDGVTLNDFGDGDTGPNGLQNFPIIASFTAIPNATRIEVSLASFAAGTYYLDFYRSPSCDSTAYGEGQFYLDFISVNTAVTPPPYTFDVSPPLTAGSAVSVTATRSSPDNNVSEFSQCVVYTTGAVTAAPVLSSPANASVTNDTTPTLSWGPAAQATSYDWQLDDNANFSSLTASGNTATRSVGVGPLSNGVTYYWRVRGKNSFGAGPYSTVFRFTVDTSPPAYSPVLLSPVNGNITTNPKPTFRWAPVPGATRYIFKICRMSDCIFLPGTYLYTSPFLTTTSLTLPVSLASYGESEFRWRVQAYDAAGNGGPESPEFTLYRGLQLAPGNRSITTDTTPTFTWNAAPGTGVTYQLRVDDDPGFGSPEVNVSGLTARTYTIPAANALNSAGLYFWRINVTPGSAWPGSGSVVATILLVAAMPPAPVTTSPANGSATSDTTPTLSWLSVPLIPGTPITYEVQVDDNQYFYNPEDTASGLATTSYTVSPALPAPPAAGKLYYWRVRAIYDGLVPGPWSTRTFRLTLP